jgi:hypothetical protein
VRSFAGFVMLALFATWGVLGLIFPRLIFAHAANMLDWAPLVQGLFPAIALVAIVTLLDQYLRLTRQGAALVGFMRVVWANAGWVLVVLLSLAPRQWVVWVGTPEQWTRFGALVNFAGRTWSLVDMVNGIVTMILVLLALASLAGPCWRLRRIFRQRGGAHTAHA